MFSVRCRSSVVRIGTSESAVDHDVCIAGDFNENVFEAKPEAERPVSLIASSDNRARRVEISKTVLLRNRCTWRENNEPSQGNRDGSSAERFHRYKMRLTIGIAFLISVVTKAARFREHSRRTVRS